MNEHPIDELANVIRKQIQRQKEIQQQEQEHEHRERRALLGRRPAGVTERLGERDCGDCLY